jgi:hypothetical protein
MERDTVESILMDSDRRIVTTMKQDFAAQVKAQAEVWQG